MKQTRNIALIVELLLLFVILLFVIVVITQTFMASRSQSLRARRLTEAVCLAEEIAEVSKSAPDKARLTAMLQDLEEVLDVTEDGQKLDIRMAFAAEDGSRDEFEVGLVREEESSGTGTFVKDQITVFYGGSTELLYEVETGQYQTEGPQE